jgi:hypothetical protein
LANKLDTRDIYGTYLYWHWAWYTEDARKPWFDRTITHEIDYPYRLGHSTLWKMPCSRRVLVVGRWVARHEDEDAAIKAAIVKRELPTPGRNRGKADCDEWIEEFRFCTLESGHEGKCE